MTLYDLVNSMTIQGNIEIAVFDIDGNEKERELFPSVDDLSCCKLAEYEDLRVTYMFPNSTTTGRAWLTIELLEEE